MEVTGRKDVQNGRRSILKMTTGFGLFSSLSKVKIYFFLLFTSNLSYFNSFKLPCKIRLLGFPSPLRVLMMTINNKSERNDRGKYLGWPVTSYGPALCFAIQLCHNLFGYVILGRQYFANFPSTLMFITNTLLCSVLLTFSLIFGNVVKHGLSCLIQEYFFNLKVILYIRITLLISEHL